MPESRAWPAGLCGRRVPVTGGAGFLGTAVVSELLAAHARVLVLDTVEVPALPVPH